VFYGYFGIHTGYPLTVYVSMPRMLHGVSYHYQSTGLVLVLGGRAAAAVQAWRPCPLLEPSPSHPIL